jgi:hypothetical protein
VKRLVSMVPVVVAAVLTAAASPATAAWSIAGTGPAAAGATIMPTGAAPTASATGSTVSVRWPTATFPNGAAVAAYTVHRYNAANGALATAGGTCAGVVTTTTCSESVTTAGSWIYTDTPVQLSWTGTESSPSNTVTT